MNISSSNTTDPLVAFQAAADVDSKRTSRTGLEPILGGSLRQKAVWVDEVSCIGCRYCAHVAFNTFVVEPRMGRSRAIRQDGDTTECIQEAIDTCPVDCIHWVEYSELPRLKAQLREQEIYPLGFPLSSRKRKPSINT